MLKSVKRMSKAPIRPRSHQTLITSGRRVTTTKKSERSWRSTRRTITPAAVAMIVGASSRIIRYIAA